MHIEHDADGIQILHLVTSRRAAEEFGRDGVEGDDKRYFLEILY